MDSSFFAGALTGGDLAVDTLSSSDSDVSLKDSPFFLETDFLELLFPPPHFR